MLRPFLTAFSGTAVEFFETVVIMYAILRAGYPREAIWATVLGHLAVFIAAIFIWPVHKLIPVFWFRVVASAMLTAMGLYWTAKSLFRSSHGLRPRWATDPLGKVGVHPAVAATAFSTVVFLVMLKSSLVEAFEILLVVFPIAAASGEWMAILAGAGLGILVVSVGTFLLHGQLKRVPEVRLKLVTGLLLSAIGISWLWELFR